MSGPTPDTPRPARLSTNKRQLVDYIAAGAKPKDKWRIGTEHEKFPFLTDTLAPVPYDGPRSIRALLEGLRDRFGWTGVYEGDNIIALCRSARAGLDLARARRPVRTLGRAARATCMRPARRCTIIWQQVREVGDALGIGFLGLGASPIWTRAETPVMPKGRYAIMAPYMDKKGKLGRDMMFRTCTVQVNLDFGSEADMVKKLRVSLALQPVATALFANSPFTEGKPNGYKCFRSAVWLDTDPDRTGMLPFAFEPGLGFERYVDYALDVPMYFVYRDGRYHQLSPAKASARFMDGKLPQLPGERPTLKDWSDHLTTIFPEVRLKRFLEMRGADSGPWRRLCALPALWTGVLYDDGSARCRLGAGQGLDRRGPPELARGGAARGAAGEDQGPLGAGCREGHAGTVARGSGQARARLGCKGKTETRFLDVLDEIAASGRTRPKTCCALSGAWNRDVTSVFRDFAY